MEEAEDDKKMELKGCFICRKIIGGGSLIGEDLDSLKLFLKYMETDSIQLMLLTEGDKVDEGMNDVNLCERCGFVMKGFWKLGKVLEAVREAMDRCCRRVYDVMIRSDDKVDAGEGKERGVEEENSVSERKRKDTLRKCSLKFPLRPRVILKKIKAPTPTPKPELQPPILEAKKDQNSDVECAKETVTPVGEDGFEVLDEASSSDESEDEDDVVKEKTKVEVEPLPIKATETISILKDILTSKQKQTLPVPMDNDILPRRRSRNDLTSSKNKEEMTKPTNNEDPHPQPLPSKKRPVPKKRRPMKRYSGRKRPSKKNPRVIKQGSCDYCRFTGNLPVVQKHQLLLHTAEVYSDQIPSGTSQFQVLEAITAALEQNMKQTGKEDCRCRHCSKRFNRKYYLRVHLIEKHFDLIAELLEESSKDIAPPPPPPQSEPLPVSKNPSTEQEAEKVELQVEVESPQANLPPPPVPRSKLEVTCEFCDHVSKNIFDVQKHKILRHTVQMYKDMVPPGTTQEEVQDAIQITLEDAIKEVGGMRKSGVRCSPCDKKFQRKYSLRVHLIEKHFDKIATRLVKPEDKQADPLRTNEDSSSSLKMEVDDLIELDLVEGDSDTFPQIVIKEVKSLSVPEASIISCTQTESHDHIKDEEEEEVPIEFFEEFSPTRDARGAIQILKTESLAFPRYQFEGTNTLQVSQKVSPSQNELTTKSKSIHVTKKIPSKFTKPIQGKRFMCHVCGDSSFKGYAQLSHHKQMTGCIEVDGKTSKKAKWFSCNYCEITSQTNRDKIRHMLQAHLLQHYSHRIPPDTTNPQIRAATKIVYNRHKLLPSGHKRCPSCSKMFLQRKTLRIHILEHHFERILNILKNLPKLRSKLSLHPDAKRTVKPKKVIKNPKAVRLLEAELFKNVKRDPVTKSWLCNFCSKSFTLKAGLRSHMIGNHTLTFFANRLAPGTTEKEMEEGVEKVVAKWITSGETDEPSFKCHLCDNICKHPYRQRRHVLHTHFEEVIAMLKS